MRLSMCVYCVCAVGRCKGGECSTHLYISGLEPNVGVVLSSSIAMVTSSGMPTSWYPLSLLVVDSSFDEEGRDI